MNFDKTKHRDNEVGNFGKRGLSWNDDLVLYYVRVYVEHDVYDMRQYIMYIGHINASDNKHDTNYFISLIQDILNCIKRILPNINRVILQSDNVISYQIPL